MERALCSNLPNEHRLFGLSSKMHTNQLEMTYFQGHTLMEFQATRPGQTLGVKLTVGKLQRNHPISMQFSRNGTLPISYSAFILVFCVCDV